MKFSVTRTLKASALNSTGGILSVGIYDTENPNFLPEIKELLIAEAEDPRGFVFCIDPEDHYTSTEDSVLPVLTTETLDDISSGEGKAEDSENPPLRAQDDEEAVNAAEKSAPSPIKSAKPRRISSKK